PPERVIRSDGTSAIAPAPHTGSDEGRPGSTAPVSPTRAPEQVEAALDALLDRKPNKPDAPAAPATPEHPASAAAETTSNLLAAKRRARQRLAEGNEPPSDQSRP